MEDTAWSESLLEFRIRRIVGAFGFLLGIQVIQVAEKLIESVSRWKELVTIAEVVLAELTGDVAKWLEHLGNGRILRPQPEVGARKSDLRKPSANRRLSGN